MIVLVMLAVIMEKTSKICGVCATVSPPNRNADWTHFVFCTSVTVRVVRHHSQFLCPHCEN